MHNFEAYKHIHCSLKQWWQAHHDIQSMAIVKCGCPEFSENRWLTHQHILLGSICSVLSLFVWLQTTLQGMVLGGAVAFIFLGCGWLGAALVLPAAALLVTLLTRATHAATAHTHASVSTAHTHATVRSFILPPPFSCTYVLHTHTRHCTYCTLTPLYVLHTHTLLCVLQTHARYSTYCTREYCTCVNMPLYVLHTYTRHCTYCTLAHVNLRIAHSPTPLCVLHTHTSHFKYYTLTYASVVRTKHTSLYVFYTQVLE